MTPGAVALAASQAEAKQALDALRALYGPPPAEIVAGLPAVLDAIAAATIAAQAEPSARRIVELRTCLAGAERQLGRIAAALEVTG